MRPPLPFWILRISRRATVPGLNLRLPPLPALRAVLVVFFDALAFGLLPPADFFADAFVRAIFAGWGAEEKDGNS